MTKPPTTYQQQMDILKSRGVVISDEEFCLNILQHLNYYRLTAYMLQYKTDSGSYDNVTFETVYNIYEFDRRLRNILLTVLEEIELSLRTKISYYHAHTFGSLGYMDDKNYNKKHRHNEFLDEFNKLVNKNKDALFVKHHIINKNGDFPIWVAVELFPFGMLSRFYADMPASKKKEFSRCNYFTGYEQLESWLICISTLRNRCAHYVRLYNFNFNKWPATPSNIKITLKNTIFDYIYVMRCCYLNHEKWKNDFFISLVTLIHEYERFIDLQLIGFPDDWERILQDPMLMPRSMLSAIQSGI